jgi:sec-independent protein translocase protein TatA
MRGAAMAIGPWQILVVAIILLLLFGATRIAGIGKGLGEGIRNFKKALSGEPDDKRLGRGDDKQDS